MMKKILLLALFLFGISYLGTAQGFSNLDFEYGAYKAQPRKWAIEGEGLAYYSSLDSLTRESGTKSLYTTLKNAQVFIFLSIPGRLIAGKSIHMQGYFKSEGTDSLEVMLMFHDPNNGRPIASQPADTKSNVWQMMSHQASFPADYSSDQLLLALMANGTGRFWFDHVRILIDGVEYGSGPPDFREPTKNEIKILNKKVVPVKSLEAASSHKDLAPLKNMIGNARLVALGENSHGSSSIYKLKLRMVKYLVENEGFSIFALETPVVEADRINEYVLHGRGNKEQVLKDLVYPSWQTQEMMDIIEWMKAYNQRRKRKIEFRGFDMQNGLSALEAAKQFAAANDPTLARDIDALMKTFNESPKEDHQWRSMAEKAEEIISYVSSRKYPQASAGSLATMRHYMDIFLQSINASYKSGKTTTRDAYMAQNLKWIMENSGPEVKVIVSADNTHVTRRSGKMGYYLKDWYGEQYLVFGFTYNTGSYAAYGPRKYYEVHPSFAGTYEYYFSRSKFANYFLDIRNFTDVEILNYPAGFRSIGSRPQETTQFVDINLKSHFDVIAYIEHSTHTRNLRHEKNQQ